MGTPSDAKRRARRPRPGKRERARVKKRRRGSTTLTVGGAGTFTLKAGRKKWQEAHLSNNPANPWGLHRFGAVGRCRPILAGNHISKVAEQAGRPLYKAGAGSEPAICHQNQNEKGPQTL